MLNPSEGILFAHQGDHTRWILMRESLPPLGKSYHSYVGILVLYENAKIKTWSKGIPRHSYIDSKNKHVHLNIKKAFKGRNQHYIKPHRA